MTVPSPVRQILLWVRTHPWRSLIMALSVVVIGELLTIPFFSIAALRTENLAETALMRQRLREAAAAGRSLRISKSWLPLSRIPRHVIDAVVVAEDGTFFSHGGFDWYEVQQSVKTNVQRRGAVRGGSTITQQLAKNLFLSTSKDPLRKAKEAIITVLLEHELSKNRILELYLNDIEWGPGIFGIEAAARAYFRKPAAALSVEEATRLAAVIPSPLRHRPDADSRYVLRRKQIVLERMTARNMAGGPIEDQPDEENEEANGL